MDLLYSQKIWQGIKFSYLPLQPPNFANKLQSLIPANISGYTVLLTLKVRTCSVKLMMPSNCPQIKQGLDIDRLATVRL